MGKWQLIFMFVVDQAGRGFINSAFRISDKKDMMLRAMQGQDPLMGQATYYKIFFSAFLWSLLPVWAGIKSKQPLRGILFAVACFVISSVIPLLNFTPCILGIGSYMYLIGKTKKAFSADSGSASDNEVKTE